MADILSLAVTPDTLRRSAKLLNSYPSETAIPSQKINHVDAIAALISEYGLQDLFAIAYLHHHQTVPEGKAMVGKLVREGAWTAARVIDDIDCKRAQPHILSVAVEICSDGSEEAQLCPAEFYEGLDYEYPYINPKFCHAFVHYICDHELVKTIGLAVRQFDLASMTEFSFSSGNLLVNKVEVKSAVNLDSFVTRWVVRNGAVDPEGQTCTAVIYPDGRKVHFVPPEQPSTPVEAWKVLQDIGWIS